MRAALQSTIVGLGIALALGACAKSVPVPDGDIAASLTIPTADGRPFDPASLRGKPSLIVFGTPTCPYCAQELPAAQKAAASENANIVAVYIAGKPEQALGVAKQLGYDGPVLHDDGSLRERYAIKGVPFTLVLGADGRATKAFRGLKSEDELRSALADAK
jgi:thiol-disulfide isomerase/thioredoxin